MKYMKHSLVAVILLALLAPTAQVEAGETDQITWPSAFTRVWEAVVDSAWGLLSEEGAVRKETQEFDNLGSEEPRSPIVSTEPEGEAAGENPLGPGDEMGGGTDPLG